MQDSHAVTIASSGTVSSVAELQGTLLVGLEMPAAWDAATIKIEGARQNSSNFLIVADETGSDKSLTVAVNRIHFFDPADWMAISRARLVSSATQTAERVIHLLVRHDNR